MSEEEDEKDVVLVDNPVDCVEKRGPGRKPDPSAKYKLSQSQMDYAVELACEGHTLTYIAEKLGITMSTLHKAKQHSPHFQNIFDAARAEGMHVTVDRLDNIHEEYEDVQRARLASENIRWKASKINSRVYGDKLDISMEHKVDIGGALKAARSRVLDSTIDLLPKTRSDDTSDNE